MRICIISDIHGNSFGLAAVLADLDRRGVDCVLGAGDMIGYYPYVNEVFELLRSREMTWIIGNHECYLLGKLTVTQKRWQSYNLSYVDRVIDDDHRRWLSQLPTERSLEFNGARWILCHGSPWRVDEYIYPDYKYFERFKSLDADVIVMGHTHIPMVRQMGRTILINPGSCGQPRDGNPLASYIWVDTRTYDIEIRRIAYDGDPIYRRILAERFDPKLTKFLYRTIGE